MSVQEITSVWKIDPPDQVAVRRLQSELGISRVLATALVIRGLTDPEVADRFLDPSLDDLYDPALLPDYREAVDAILGARERSEKIYVHGDYDVDGVTSAALFTRFLRKIGCDVVPHVPHRMREGYGIHLDAIKFARDAGSQLFLTCDCGVSAHEQVLAAREAGMRVVITDHHLVGDSVPEAVAVVNPHRPGSNYPWPEISGVGVVFKLCAGITKEIGLKVQDYYRAYLDLAVLGTVADVMPLIDENRVITKFGLIQLAASNKKGVRALLDIADLTGKPYLTARHIGFQIGPRINAVGRIDDAAHALDLLLTEDATEAARLAALLDAHNEERRAEQNRILDEATENVIARGPLETKAIVVANTGWHPGVIGIVAGKLVERFRRPSFVISVGADGMARGSARSVPGFDLGQAIEAARPHLESGGGHELAAGFSLLSANLGALESALDEFSSRTLTREMCLPTFTIDSVVEGAEASAAIMGDMARLEPFGQGNPEPLFATLGAKIVSLSPTRNPDHARLTIEAHDGTRHQAMAFGIGRALDEIGPNVPLDIAFTLESSEWNGVSQFRWIVRDYRPAVD